MTASWWPEVAPPILGCLRLNQSPLASTPTWLPATLLTPPAVDAPYRLERRSVFTRLKKKKKLRRPALHISILTWQRKPDELLLARPRPLLPPPFPSNPGGFCFSHSAHFLEGNQLFFPPPNAAAVAPAFSLRRSHSSILLQFTRL